MPPPLFDDYLRLFQAEKYLAIEQFIPEAGVETFTVSIATYKLRSYVLKAGGNRNDDA